MTELNCGPIYTTQSCPLQEHDLSTSPNADPPQYTCHWQLRAKNSTIQELPAEEPSCELESPTVFQGSRGRFGSIPAPPWLDFSGRESPSSHLAPDTPISLDFLHGRASESTRASSHSSYFNLQGLRLELQEPKIEVDAARKIKFLQNTKKADFVALSPNSEYAAFVFTNNVQVCRVSFSTGALKPFEIKVMLTSGKKGGKFVAAAMSDAHLVAISDKEVCYTPKR